MPLKERTSVVWEVVVMKVVPSGMVTWAVSVIVILVADADAMLHEMIARIASVGRRGDNFIV